MVGDGDCPPITTQNTIYRVQVRIDSTMTQGFVACWMWQSGLLFCRVAISRIFNWTRMLIPSGKLYNITLENHHYQWENQL